MSEPPLRRAHGRALSALPISSSARCCGRRPGCSRLAIPLRGIAVSGQGRGRARSGLVPYEPEGHAGRRIGQEARDGLRHDAALLRPRPALDEHVEVELLRGQPFQGVAADVAEAALVHAFEQPLFEIGVAQPAGVVVAQDAFDVGGGQHLADDVEHRVVVQRVADLLELVQEPLQHPAFDGVRGREVEDEAVLALAVAVDAAHPLLQPVGVPGDVVVEEDVADLEVDPLARRLRGHQDLDRALAEALLGVEPRTGLVARAGLHPAVDGPDREAPVPEPADEMVEGVAELREDEQALVGPVEEALVAEQVLKPRELRFRPGRLDGSGLPRKVPELGGLLPDLPGVGGQGHRFEHPFEALALALLHLLDLVRAGEVRRRGAGRPGPRPASALLRAAARGFRGFAATHGCWTPAGAGTATSGSPPRGRADRPPGPRPSRSGASRSG